MSTRSRATPWFGPRPPPAELARLRSAERERVAPVVLELLPPDATAGVFEALSAWATEQVLEAQKRLDLASIVAATNVRDGWKDDR